MTFSVVPAQPSDVEDIVTILLDAFEDDPIIGLMWNTVDPKELHAYHVRRYAKMFETADRDGTHFWKAVDDRSG